MTPEEEAHTPPWERGALGEPTLDWVRTELLAMQEMNLMMQRRAKRMMRTVWVCIGFSVLVEVLDRLL